MGVSAIISTVVWFSLMVTSLNLVYSAAAVKRMLGAAVQVVRIEKWWKVCLVIFRGQRPRFMSRAAFIQHFVQMRKAQAQALTAQQWGCKPIHFTVRNKAKGTEYHLEAKGDRIDCRCEDYSNQIKFLGRGCCKHGYAVLDLLGFDSLQAYSKAHGSNGYLRSRNN